MMIAMRLERLYCQVYIDCIQKKDLSQKIQSFDYSIIVNFQILEKGGLVISVLPMLIKHALFVTILCTCSPSRVPVKSILTIMKPRNYLVMIKKNEFLTRYICTLKNTDYIQSYNLLY